MFKGAETCVCSDRAEADLDMKAVQEQQEEAESH